MWDQPPQCGKELRTLRIIPTYVGSTITKDTPAPYYNESGVLIMSVYDFLLNENSLEI